MVAVLRKVYGGCMIPTKGARYLERLAMVEGRKVCIIHGLKISHKELTYLLQKSTSRQKPSIMRMLLGGIDW